MKKYILPIIIAVAFIVLIAYFYKFNLSDEIDYNTQKLGTELKNDNSSQTAQPTVSEEEISSFSTKIIDEDSNRDTNMELTCNAINGTIVKKGEEFSFNQVAGNPTPDRGYKKAGIIVNGNSLHKESLPFLTTITSFGLLYMIQSFSNTFHSSCQLYTMFI